MISNKQVGLLFDSEYMVLGCGYVGSFFLQKHPNVFYSNRLDQPPHPQKNNQILFDLMKKYTWTNIKNSKNILWTFPAARNEIEIHEAVNFFTHFLKNKNVIILSSTSAYFTNYKNEIINEKARLLLNYPRFNAEERLRKQGATILHLSGIIGPNRQPLDWYKKNLVTNGDKILNYIHVHDIIYFIEKLFQKFIPYERFNLSSQDYKTHDEISKKLIELGHLKSDFSFLNKIEENQSKKICSLKILNYLNENSYNFAKYPEDI